MSATFKGNYRVEDGYHGSGRPHTFRISADDLEDDMDDNDLAELFNNLMVEHFSEFVSPSGENEDEFVEWAKEQLSKRED